MSDFTRDLFVSECTGLQTFAEAYRKCMNTLIEMMIKITLRQENPKAALGQLIETIKMRCEQELGDSK